MLATCEKDYAQTSAWFGGISSPTLPVNVILAAIPRAKAAEAHTTTAAARLISIVT